MDDDRFDALVDDATHAVNNLIPDKYLDNMGDMARSGLLVSINDALTAILRDVIESAAPDSRNPTRVSTIAAAIGELIESHITKCDEAFPRPDDCPAHVISDVHGTAANVTEVGIADLGLEHLIHIKLDDGTAFNIRVEEA